jgi:DNA sulfur modification protein DndD
MWFSKIEMVCFKSYQRQEFEFPRPEDGRNVVLIGGMNGYGKTSILEALYLCLYGKDAMSHLARAGLKSDEMRGYPTFLEKAFNGEALREKRDTMIVKVTINQTNTKAVEVARKWYFTKNGKWSDEEATIREIIRGVPDLPRADGRGSFSLSQVLEEILVPAHIAPFFFFDGEEVKKLADQNRVEQVKQGLEGLLGVVLLRGLAERLKGFEQSKRDGVSAVDEGKLAQLWIDLQQSQESLAGVKSKIDEFKQRKLELSGQFDSIMERIAAAGGGGGDAATFKDAIEEKEFYKVQLRDVQRKLEEIIATKLPLKLVSQQVTASLKSRLYAESRLIEWEDEKRTLEPRQIQFFESFENQSAPKMEPDLSDSQRKALKERMNAAWAALFYPAPSDCADQIEHSYLSNMERTHTLKRLENTTLGQQEVNDILRKQNELETKIEELGRKIARLEGIDRDGTLASLTANLKEVQEQIQRMEDHLREEERRLIGLEALERDQRAAYERDRRKLDDSSPARSVIDRSERVRKVIDRLVPELFPLKVSELSKHMTTVYQQLAHKSQVAKIQVDDDGATQILSKSGQVLQFDRSAGENQIFATALIAALARVSGVQAPLVVDTPLGRLDSMHRDNILRFWTSDSSRQVILLSQDEEIGGEILERIGSSVSKTYLLQHEEVGDGIGRTTAISDQYFGGRKN